MKPKRSWSGHDPLTTSHLIVSLQAQAAMIRKNREGAVRKLHPEYVKRLQEARANINAVLNNEDRDERDRATFR